MNKEPTGKVSVIVPVYNIEKYIEKCLESISQQTYTNLEIIIINDGSTDDSLFICQSFTKEDNRAKLITKENAGLGYARNTGLDIATGEFVLFVDGDDLLEVNAIADLVDAVKAEEADTIIGDFKRFDDDGTIYDKKIQSYGIYENNDIYEEIMYRMIGSAPEKSDSRRMSVWNVLFSREIIENNKIRFVSERDYYQEDLCFNIEYYRFSKKVVVLDSCGYLYRYNFDSLTTKYNRERLEKSNALYIYMKEKFEEYHFSNDAFVRMQRNYFICIRGVINQEIKNPFNIFSRLCNIKNVCNNNLLCQVIREYPVNKMGIKQKIFIYLVKYKCILALYILAKVKIV